MPNEFAQDLVEALAELTVIEKNRTARIPTKDGKSYEYDYADIQGVVEVTRPVLAAHGIVALTPIHDHGHGLACTVTLIHKSGERLDLGPFPFPPGATAQATGSAVTYHRRYALLSALGMAAGDDDDGAGANPRPQVEEPTIAIIPKSLQDAWIARIAELPEEFTAELVKWFHDNEVPPIKRLPVDRADDVEVMIEHYENLADIQQMEQQAEEEGEVY